MVVSHWVVMNKGNISRSNVQLQGRSHLSPEELYHDRHWNYPKFFKMDKLCKWAWAGAEYLLSGEDALYHGIDKSRIAVVLATAHGCIDVDKRYQDSIAMPSPALFVYTLSNIMLGEICIRHGFKGEQLCMVSEGFDADELYFTVHDLLSKRDMEACLCGWVDVSEGQHDVRLYWVTRGGRGVDFSAAGLRQLTGR